MTEEEMIVSLTRQENEITGLSRRMKACESQNEAIHTIALSVNKLAVTMEHMLNEQKDQGKRLTALERQPGERLNRLRDAVVKCLLSGVLGALLGALMGLILR